MSFEFLRDSFPVAHKNYRCVWCGEMIPQGMQHTLQVGKMDGDFQSNRWHDECFKFGVSEGDFDIDDGFSLYDNERPTIAKESK